jgi:hypothetical protein
MRKYFRTAFASITLLTTLSAPLGCSGDDTTGSTHAGGADGGSTSAGGSAGTSAAVDAAAATDGVSVDALADCSTATTNIDKVVCQANAFLGTLPADQLASVNLAWSDAADRTKWSNLPGVARAGVAMGSLSTTSQAAALALMTVVLSSAGLSDLTGVRAADDYLGTMGGGPGGGGMATYSSNNYSVAIFGTPSATGNWEVTFGGHHMAYNVNFLAGTGYPIPNHLGVEPKASITLNGTSYQPMVDEGAAMQAIFASLSASDLNTAYLAGQTFADVLIGPAEYGTGSSAAAKGKYPTGANRTGVLVSSLSAAQQALVTAAIGEWVNDYDPAIASPLFNAYTTDAAYADTYVAWGGTLSAGVDVDVNGTYMRIDGPRAWIEVACQAGVVISGATHYHSIYRDKQFDYGGTL